MQARYKVLVSDKLAEEGLEVFRSSPHIELVDRPGLKPEELLAIIGEYHGLAIRSGTKVTQKVLEAASSLKVIGRAGIGVDNVDVPAASARGILVMNTPDGNVVTTAEHAISLMCALARKIPAATASMKAGRWEKTKFEGRELTGKTLGVVGLGNIGKIVANRALGLRMKVVAFDPFVTKERARELGVELLELDDLLARSQFVTLHVPLLEGTRNIIDQRALAKMPAGSFLINAARGGLVDEAAVVEALRSGHLAGAAFDVFEKEPPPADHPFFGLDDVVLTPHLGASTEEAQVNVAVAVAEQIVAFLGDGVVQNAVNAPGVSAELMDTLGPYVELGRKMGRMAGQLHKGGVLSIRSTYAGEVSKYPVAPITAAMLTGVLESALGHNVNPVSAPYIAKERGIEVVEEKRSKARDFADAITVSISGEGETEVVGAVFGRDDPRIVSVNGFRLEVVPDGFVILTHHRDRPGIIGRIGSILGEHAVNISRLNLSKAKAGELAEAVLSVDSRVSQEVLDAIANIDGIEWAKQLDLS